MLPRVATPQPPLLPPAPPDSSLRYSAQPAETPPEKPKPVPRSLRVALVAVGLVMVLLIVAIPGREIAYRIGGVIGALVFWPLIIIGLFSIGRRFRTPTARATITLVVWSLLLVGQLATLSVYRRGRALLEQTAQSRAASTPSRTPGNVEFTITQIPTPARPTVSSASARLAASFDFSNGSDERIIKLVESTQEKNYHEAVAAYEAACALRPTDAALALERVKFIEHFADSEDVHIESAEDDLHAAKEYLTHWFPNAPGTVLYVLERTYGPAFDDKADGYTPLVTRWAAAQRGRFYLLRAQRVDDGETGDRRRRYAVLSFSANPSTAAGLILARAALRTGNTEEGRSYLTHPVFQAAVPWEKKQAMDLLFDLKENARAFALFEELKSAGDTFVASPETATRLTRAGYIDAAREIFKALEVGDWNRARVMRSRFDFELAYGTAETALAAYRDYRASGFGVDLLLRDRFALLLKHPTLGWNVSEIGGLFLLGLVVVALVFAPALLLMPVHYWSLLRTRKGKTGGMPEARWGLRTAWVVLAVMAVSEFAALWLLRPDVMRTYFAQPPPPLTAPSDVMILVHQGSLWLVMIALMICALGFSGRWNMLGRANWSVGRCIGFGLAGAVILRIVLLTYTIVFPNAVSGGLATFSPETQQIGFALLKLTTPAGLILTIAVLVPILEEFLFRGLLLEALAKHIPFGWANAAQALAFASLHENARILPVFFTFGLICGWLVRRSGGGLLASMVMHAFNNLLASFVIMAAYRASLITGV